MDAKLGSLFSDIVDYIEVTQPVLEKQAAQRQALKTKVAYAVDTMVGNRLVSPAIRNDVVNDLSEHPEKLAELLAKVSEKVGPDSLGGASERLDAGGLDAILKFVLD